MFNDSFDEIILGESIPSYLYGIEKLKQKEIIQLVKTDVVKEGEPFAHNISAIEKNFLEMWAAAHLQGAFSDLSPYLDLTPQYVHFAGRRVYLGERPALNLLELHRKFPHWSLLASADETYIQENLDLIDLSIFEMINRFVNLVWAYKSVTQVPITEVFGHGLPIVSRAFEAFTNQSLASSKVCEFDDFRELLYLAKGKGRQAFSFAGKDIEFFYSFLTLLAPSYKFQKRNFKNLLQNFFLQLDGTISSDEINKWVARKSRLRQLEFSGHQGLVDTKEVKVFSPFLKRVVTPFSKKNSYRMIKVTWATEQSFVDSFHVLSVANEVGLDFPYIEIEFTGNEINFLVYGKFKKAQRLKYVYPGLFALCLEKVNQIVSLSKEQVSREQVEYLDECTFHDDYLDFKFQSLFPPVPRKVAVELSPREFKSFENMKYLGPTPELKFGLISELLSVARNIH